MNKSQYEAKAIDKRKANFKYLVELLDDGSVIVKDTHGKEIEGKVETPDFDEIINSRELTVFEAQGSEYIFIYPYWYQIGI